MSNINDINSKQVDIKLDIFEGPLDLLLNLIKENDLDIYELSLTMITEQYLEYVELLKEIDFDDIGEYLVVAAELARIKSRMLLQALLLLHIILLYNLSKIKRNRSVVFFKMY